MESKLAVFSSLLDVRELAGPVVPHTSPFRHSAGPHEHLCPTQDGPTQVSSMAKGLPSGTLIALRHTPMIAQFCLQTLINVSRVEGAGRACTREINLGGSKVSGSEWHLSRDLGHEKWAQSWQGDCPKLRKEQTGGGKLIIAITWREHPREWHIRWRGMREGRWKGIWKVAGLNVNGINHVSPQLPLFWKEYSWRRSIFIYLLIVA